MKYVFYQGKSEQPVFILLHGTGGDETSLIEVGTKINEQATLIGIRGETVENGYPRFFKRLAEGRYDEIDLAKRTVELHEFIQEILDANKLSKEDVVLIGYSNGANIGIKLLLDYPKEYQKAILFHPMYPVAVEEQPDLSQTNVFVTMGKKDPIVSITESQRVLDLLSSRGANVVKEWTRDHQLTYLEVEEASDWLKK